MLEQAGEKFFQKIHPGEVIDIPYFRRQWEEMHRTGTGYLVAEFQGDVPVGIMGIALHKDIWRNEVIAVIQCLYSEGKDGVQLFNAAEQIARQLKASKLIAKRMYNNDRIDSFYVKRKKFKPETVIYVKEL